LFNNARAVAAQNPTNAQPGYIPLVDYSGLQPEVADSYERLSEMHAKCRMQQAYRTATPQMVQHGGKLLYAQPCTLASRLLIWSALTPAGAPELPDSICCLVYVSAHPVAVLNRRKIAPDIG
jgi:hypothetical protein